MVKVLLRAGKDQKLGSPAAEGLREIDAELDAKILALGVKKPGEQPLMYTVEGLAEAVDMHPETVKRRLGKELPRDHAKSVNVVFDVVPAKPAEAFIKTWSFIQEPGVVSQGDLARALGESLKNFRRQAQRMGLGRKVGKDTYFTGDERTQIERHYQGDKTLDDLLVGVPEFAQRLGVSAPAVQSWVERLSEHDAETGELLPAEIPYIRVGGDIKFPREFVEDDKAMAGLRDRLSRDYRQKGMRDEQEASEKAGDERELLRKARAEVTSLLSKHVIRQVSETHITQAKFAKELHIKPARLTKMVEEHGINGMIFSIPYITSGGNNYFPSVLVDTPEKAAAVCEILNAGLAEKKYLKDNVGVAEFAEYLGIGVEAFTALAENQQNTKASTLHGVPYTEHGGNMYFSIDSLKSDERTAQLRGLFTKAIAERESFLKENADIRQFAAAINYDLNALADLLKRVGVRDEGRRMVFGVPYLEYEGTPYFSRQLTASPQNCARIAAMIQSGAQNMERVILEKRVREDQRKRSLEEFMHMGAGNRDEHKRRQEQLAAKIKALEDAKSQRQRRDEEKIGELMSASTIHPPDIFRAVDTTKAQTSSEGIRVLASFLGENQSGVEVAYAERFIHAVEHLTHTNKLRLMHLLTGIMGKTGPGLAARRIPANNICAEVPDITAPEDLDKFLTEKEKEYGIKA